MASATSRPAAFLAATRAAARPKAMQAHVAALLAGAPRQSVLLCDSSKQGEDGGDELRRGAANLPWVDCIPQLGLNVYSILQVGAGGGRAAGGGGSFTGVLRTAHDHSAPPARPDSPLSSPPSQRDYLVLSRRAADRPAGGAAAPAHQALQPHALSACCSGGAAAGVLLGACSLCMQLRRTSQAIALDPNVYALH